MLVKTEPLRRIIVWSWRGDHLAAALALNLCALNVVALFRLGRLFLQSPNAVLSASDEYKTFCELRLAKVCISLSKGD